VLTIPADIILQKNKLFSGYAFFELLEWQVSELSQTVRLVNNNEDVSWGGYTWTKFYFEGGGESDTGGDSSVELTVNVSAVDRVIQGYLEQLTNGGVGDTAIYRRVHSNYLNLAAAITSSYEILDIDAGPDNEWVVFNLGQENFFLSQFPANVFRRYICRYMPWMTDVCPYTDSSTCNRTFGRCITLGQTSVFGGQPGIPGGAFNVSDVLSKMYLESGGPDGLMLEDGSGDLILE